MKFFTQSLTFRKLCFTTVVLCCFGFVHAAVLFENFDSPSAASTNNNGATLTYPSGAWFTNGITKPTNPTENDRIIGLYSQRMRGLDGKNLLQMNFDKAGAGVLSFKYGSYSNHRGGEFTIEQSTNAGSTWTPIGSSTVIPAWSGTFLTYSLPVNYNGNIRFRLKVALRTPNNANEQFNVDDWMITDYGTDQVATPVSTVSTGVYETAQNVSLSSATAGATIYYTTDGTTPTTSSTVYSTAINVSSTTRIKAIAVAAGKADSREEEVLITFPETVTTLAQLYTKMAATGTNFSYFKYTGEAIVTTSYTATYYTVFLQDNSAGILINDVNKNLKNAYASGDKVTGLIAQVNRINDSPQLYPYADFTVVSNGNNIVPPVVTLSNVTNYTYQLVQINNVTFTEANGTKTFGPNSPYTITDASVTSTTTTFRTPSGMPNPDYINTIIPEKRNIICLVAKNSSAVTTHYLFTRNAADLNVQATDIQTAISSYIKISGNTLFIESPEPHQVKIFNANGQLIKSFISNGGVNNLELAKGAYIISIGDKKAKVMM